MPAGRQVWDAIPQYNLIGVWGRAPVQKSGSPDQVGG